MKSAAAMGPFERLVTRILEALVSVGLLAIFGLVVTLVVLRYLFNSSITGANELVTILFVYTTALGAALAVGRREHVAILFATELLPLRARKAVDACTLLLVALVNAVLVATSVGWIAATGDFLMPSTGLPRAAAQISVPLGCGLAVLYCVLRLIRPLSTEDVSRGPAERRE